MYRDCNFPLPSPCCIRDTRESPLRFQNQTHACCGNPLVYRLSAALSVKKCQQTEQAPRSSFFERLQHQVQVLPRNIKLTLAYDGHDFAGWQVQPDRPTIQGALVSVIEQITGEKTLPQGSGRTDAGVHALAQVATVSIESPIPVANFRKALNDILPSAIRVLNIEEVNSDFHARKSARAKTYRYRIYREEICPPFLA